MLLNIRSHCDVPVAAKDPFIRVGCVVKTGCKRVGGRSINELGSARESTTSVRIRRIKGVTLPHTQRCRK